MQLKIEYLNKSQLKPYANNAKIHTEEQVRQIRESIEEFDFNDPIAIWGENEIVEGHGRLLAAMEMDGVEAVPVIRLDHLNDKQRRAYMLAHNKLTMNTDFDLDILGKEIEDLVDDFDLTDLGFNEAEILELTIDDSPEPAHGKSAAQFVGVFADGDDAYPPVDAQAGAGEDAGAYTHPFAGDEQDVSRGDLAAYAANAAQMVTRRVIIVYKDDEEEAFVKGLLGVEPDKELGVIYLAKSLMEGRDEEN